MMDSIKYPCPCCGYFMFENPPGSYDICEICCWEDDLSQLRFPSMGGANRVGLIEGQLNFDKFGASELRHLPRVGTPKPEEKRDLEWRPINQDTDHIERPAGGTDYGETYPKDLTVLYYWRHTYWGR